MKPYCICVSLPKLFHLALYPKGHSCCRSAAAAKSLQSCPTLCDPIDSSPPGSPIPGILQARTLEWVAIAFSIFQSSCKLSREETVWIQPGQKEVNEY